MACIEYPLCKYAHYENGSLVCQTGEPCAFQRYCSTLLKVIHTSAYKTCKEAKNLAKKKRTYDSPITEKIEAPIQKGTENIIEKYEICKARYDNGFIFLEFKGYGLVTPNTHKHDEAELQVFYSGEIGKPGFKFWL